ncbi:hypothetical protein PVAP13_7KG326600 [Panicum virgatum]|uniref:Uncharacterized protein n=1 Tax=Panicum virgatum TaxID=38727 RepID=A0A8T0QKS5_PANVG|nr:hypothetical protein PVAP13_7KG326600 [Panicum virgatum]
MQGRMRIYHAVDQSDRTDGTGGHGDLRAGCFGLSDSLSSRLTRTPPPPAPHGDADAASASAPAPTVLAPDSSPALLTRRSPGTPSPAAAWSAVAPSAAPASACRRPGGSRFRLPAAGCRSATGAGPHPPPDPVEASHQCAHSTAAAKPSRAPLFRPSRTQGALRVFGELPPRQFFFVFRRLLLCSGLPRGTLRMRTTWRSSMSWPPSFPVTTRCRRSTTSPSVTSL